MITPEVKSRLAKIYELVKRGTDGEKAAAQVALDKLLSKYNLEGINLESLNKDKYHFKYKTSLDERILVRLINILIDDPEVYKTACKDTWHKKEIILHMTYLDYITITCAYEYFRKHMHAQWVKICMPELKRCRKTKTKNARRKELEPIFFSHYVFVSNLYKPEEVSRTHIKSAKELKDRMAMQHVEGGTYNKQMTSGLLLN